MYKKRSNASATTPTSLPASHPIRLALERLQEDIVAEMNGLQSGPLDMRTRDWAKKLGGWNNRLTEAIHFNGEVPPAITGIEPEPHVLEGLDDAMVMISYIATDATLALASTHAKLAFERMHEFRHKLVEVVTVVVDEMKGIVRTDDDQMLGRHRTSTDMPKFTINEIIYALNHDILGRP